MDSVVNVGIKGFHNSKKGNLQSAVYQHFQQCAFQKNSVDILGNTDFKLQGKTQNKNRHSNPMTILLHGIFFMA